MSTLEEILGNSEVEEQESKPEEAVVETTEEAAEAGDNASQPEGVKEKPEQEEPEQEEAEPPSAKDVPLAALLDERDKRKNLQAELDAARRQIEESKDNPDFWENPQATVESMISSKVDELQNQYTSGYLNLSMQYSKAFHDDFDDAKDAFIKAAEENPALADAAVQSDMPGEYIYKTGKEFLALQTYGDVESAIEAERRKAVEEYIAQQAEKDKGKAEKVAAVPTPLTEESSAGSPRQKVEGGPTPLGSILHLDRG